jgi:hypothetical protein
MILIAPYSKPLRNGKRNPKDYPYWAEVINELKHEYSVIQLAFGQEPTLPNITDVFRYTSLKQVEKLVDSCETWISTDNFLQHLAHIKKKRGVVVWGVGDPKLFGYPENINVLKDPKYLRIHQFQTWEEIEYNEDAFSEPKKVVEAVHLLTPNRILEKPSNIYSSIQTPNLEVTMAESIKFTEQEMKSIQDFQTRYARLSAEAGQLTIREFQVDHQSSEISVRRNELRSELNKIREEEKQLADKLSTKYGQGQLNPQTGIFTPTATPAQS